jgi:hypothetical protein
MTGGLATGDKSGEIANPLDVLPLSAAKTEAMSNPALLMSEATAAAGNANFIKAMSSSE